MDIGGDGGNGKGGNGNVSMSREASMTSPTRGSGAQSPTLPAMAFSCVLFQILFSEFMLIAAVDRDGERYLDDDDILSSGQVSPLSMCSFLKLQSYLTVFT
jgi:hypothetical protein